MFDEEAPRTYYVAGLSMRGQIAFMVWHSPGGVVVDDGEPKLWGSAEEARRAAKKLEGTVSDQETVWYDIGAVEDYVDAGSARLPVDDLLHYWDLFSDLAESLGIEDFTRRDAKLVPLHDRLLALSGVTEEQERAEELNAEDHATLQELFSHLLPVVVSVFERAPPHPD